MSYLLHIQFDFTGKTGNLHEDLAVTFPFAAATQKMNALPDLQWKIWAVNTDDPKQTKGSGFYLYPTRAAAERRAEEGRATLPRFPGISNVSTTIWAVLDDYSLATHGPVDVPLIANLP